MTIDFSVERWQQVKEAHRKWWAGELDRPLVYAGKSKDPGREPAPLPDFGEACWDMSVPPVDVIDIIDYGLCGQTFLYDSYPGMNMAFFGPGISATFMGAKAKVTPHTVWFLPPKDQPISEVHLEYNPNHPLLCRIKDICAAANERWGGLIQVAMTDLGGNLDILATFRPGEQLLLDLYDHPDEVQRVLWEAHECWHKYYDDINAVLQPTNPGYTCWDGLFSNTPYYILQCDFAYMISPEMFDQFVAPELATTCKRLSHTVYHLDGVGQLPHVDSLLAIDDLDGIQWVPGEGQPWGTCWADLFCRILEAGKKIQLYCTHDLLDIIAQRVGTTKGCVVWLGGSEEELSRTNELLARYGLPPI